MTENIDQSIPPDLAGFNSAQISRRALLAGAGGATAISLFGTSGIESASAENATVRWANWSLYLDYDNKSKKYPTLVDFTKKTGIPVKYMEAIDDNDTFTAKVTPQLKLKKDIGYDIVVPTEWMAARWINSGFVQKFDDAAVPNKKNVLPFLLNRPLDPGRHYSLPWAGIIAGMAWNKRKLPAGINSIEDKTHPERGLFSNPALKGKIEVLSEMRDTIGLIMMWQGVDISKPFTQDKFDNALNYLQKKIKDGWIRQIKGQSYAEDMISGDAVAVIGWSGDINQLNLQNQNQFGFAIPESGGTFSTDNMMIPSTSTNKAGAEAVINYYYDPVVAARVANYINYVCPVSGAKEAMAKISPAQAKNPLIFPDDAMWKNLKVFRDLTAAEQIKFSTSFQKASGNA
ncbi:MAG: spermidine/putrescine ABC transporter substrate-binding protein [Actinobacteria bacterium]|nr:spermidine/putrescine ABC transporter substrate-binding protein [Actinomycetota bacterium]